MRGFKSLAGAQVVCCAHAFVWNLPRHFDEFGDASATATRSAGASLLHAWDRLTAELLAR